MSKPVGNTYVFTHRRNCDCYLCREPWFSVEQDVVPVVRLLARVVTAMMVVVYWVALGIWWTLRTVARGVIALGVWMTPRLARMTRWLVVWTGFQAPREWTPSEVIPTVEPMPSESTVMPSATMPRVASPKVAYARREGARVIGCDHCDDGLARVSHKSPTGTVLRLCGACEPTMGPRLASAGWDTTSIEL